MPRYTAHCSSDFRSTDMAEVIPVRKPSPKEKHKGKNLCRHGHHKWSVDTKKQFDVKAGKLVTVYHCVRCGEKKVTSH